MAKKKEEDIKIKEIRAPISPVSPLFSNIAVVFSHEEVVMLDFGFISPSYAQPHNIEDSQLARICLPWDTAEFLSESLKDVISDHKKEQESRRRRRTKS
jgi:methylglyoxal synthase